MPDIDNVKTRTKSPLSKFLPVIGGILALCMIVLAFASSSYVNNMALRRAPGRYPPPVLAGRIDLTAIHPDLGSVTAAQLAITFALWAIYMVAAWTLVAALAKATEPNKKAKKQLNITEKSLKEERKQIEAEKQRKKKQRKKLQKKAFQENKDKGERLGG